MTDLKGKMRTKETTQVAELLFCRYLIRCQKYSFWCILQ